MPYWLNLLILLVIAGLALGGMYLGWHHRVASSEPLLAALPAMPDDDELGDQRSARFEAIYVSTTRAGDWLDRVAAGDLGVRSTAEVQVFASGVRIVRRGARDVFIAASHLESVATAPGMAGKFVGGDGLVVVTWHAGPDVLLDTGLRLRRRADTAPLITAVEALCATSPKENP